MNKGFLLVIFFLGIILLSGCWSKKELTDIAIVSAFGIDKDENGKFVGTIQVINPGNVSGGAPGSTHSSNGPPINVYSETGTNLVEISKKFSTKLSRRLYYAHTNLVVIGEELAREEGILHIFDAMERDPEFRITPVVVIAQDTMARDILRTLTPIDKIPSNKVIKTLKSTEKNWGSHLYVNLKDVLNSLASEGKEPLISGFRLIGEINQAKKMENLQETTPEATLMADGIAVFKDGKLVDWLQGETARGSLWILDKVKKTDLNIDWEGNEDAIAYETTRQTTKLIPLIKKGKPMIRVDVRVEGEIGEVNVPVDLSNPEIIVKIQTEIEKEIKREILEAVQQVQKNKSDVFGFGEVVQRSDPNVWRKLKSEWNNVYFPDLIVDARVEAFVRRSGLQTKSFLFELEENR